MTKVFPKFILKHLFGFFIHKTYFWRKTRYYYFSNLCNFFGERRSNKYRHYLQQIIHILSLHNDFWGNMRKNARVFKLKHIHYYHCIIISLYVLLIFYFDFTSVMITTKVFFIYLLLVSSGTR